MGICVVENWRILENFVWIGWVYFYNREMISRFWNLDWDWIIKYEEIGWIYFLVGGNDFWVRNYCRGWR